MQWERKFLYQLNDNPAMDGSLSEWQNNRVSDTVNTLSMIL